MPRIEIERRPKARQVAERWKRTYYQGGKWSEYVSGHSKEAIHAALSALPDDAPRAAIDAAIGNDSWTTLRCQCCEQDSDRVWVVSGDEYSTYLCQDCIEAAASEISGR